MDSNHNPRDFDRLVRRFREFGGWRLVRAYARMGVLWTGVGALWRCLLHGRSFKAAYPAITERVARLLAEQYGHILDEAVEKAEKAHDADGGKADGKEIPKLVWSCWLQGYEQAPPLVKACLRSQREQLPDYDHRLLTLDNYGQWVTLPDEVVEKHRRGWIPAALFSDLLRLAVLYKYGGLWLDASVLCTGFGNERLQRRWRGIERSQLTLFRYFRRGQSQAVGLSNWFIAARKGDTVVGTVLRMLLAYWHDYDCAVDYYMMHLFLGMSLRAFPKTLAAMPRENSYHSTLLGGALDKTFREADWQDLTAHVSFHKLGYRQAADACRNPKSYCSRLVAASKTWRANDAYPSPSSNHL